jgi:hypothetical protein
LQQLRNVQRRIIKEELGQDDLGPICSSGLSVLKDEFWNMGSLFWGEEMILPFLCRAFPLFESIRVLQAGTSPGKTKDFFTGYSSDARQILTDNRNILSFRNRG